MKYLPHILVTVLFWATAAFAETVAVKRNVNLRCDASTGVDIIETLQPGAQLQLLESDKRDGYYHVSAPDGKEGWVWGRNVRIVKCRKT